MIAGMVGVGVAVSVVVQVAVDVAVSVPVAVAVLVWVSTAVVSTVWALAPQAHRQAAAMRVSRCAWHEIFNMIRIPKGKGNV